MNNSLAAGHTNTDWKVLLRSGRNNRGYFLTDSCILTPIFHEHCDQHLNVRCQKRMILLPVYFLRRHEIGVLHWRELFSAWGSMQVPCHEVSGFLILCGSPAPEGC